MRTKRGTSKNGRRLLTKAGVCILAIVSYDVVFALDSLAALSATKTSFIAVAAIVLATIAQRSTCFGDVGRIAFPRKSTVALLALLGARLIVERHLHVSPALWLAAIAVLVCAGIAESIRARRPIGT